MNPAGQKEELLEYFFTMYSSTLLAVMELPKLNVLNKF